jgi:uncharacterized membrane protein YgdD (TMEM256/DUF423 family)
MQRSVLSAAAWLGALAVASGAFGAHGLEATPVRPDLLEAYRTGASYHLWHALALLGLGAAWPRLEARRARAAALAFGAGVLLFSGSLYAMALADAYGGGASFLGPVTPLGGLALIGGWALLGLAARRGPGA